MKPGLPSVDPKIDPSTRKLLEGLKEVAEVGEGKRGNLMDRNIKLRDLLDLGLVKILGGLRGGIVGSDLQPTIKPPTLAIPPAPSGLTVTGGFSSIFLKWDDPQTLYDNHSYTIIYRHDEDNVAEAQPIAQVAVGMLFADSDVTYGTEYYYWIRFVSDAEVKGPFNSPVGTVGKISEDPSELLERLSNKITESELYDSLNTRINLIDNPGDGLVVKTNALGTTTAQHGTSIAQLQFDVTPLKARWSVKTQVGDLVGGIGFYNNGVTTQFYVAANTFAVYSPGATSMSFVVDDGKVVMDGAFIKNLSVNAAALGLASVDTLNVKDAAISSLKLQDGSVTNLKIGNVIQSTNYVPGLSGWIFNKLGNIEVHDIYARGDIRASSLQAGTAMVDTLHVNGEAITARRFGQGSSGTISDGSTVTVLTMPSLSLPASISGIVIDMSATVSTSTGNCNVFIEIYRNSTKIGERHAGAINDMSLCVSTKFYDSSPGTSPVYELRMRAGANPGGGGGGDYYCGTPTLIIDAAKR